MNVYLLAEGAVLPEFVRRPLAAAGHQLQVFSAVDESDYPRLFCLRGRSNLSARFRHWDGFRPCPR